MANKKAPCRWDGTGATAQEAPQQLDAPTVAAERPAEVEDLAFLQELAEGSLFITRGGRRRRGTRAVDVLRAAQRAAFHGDRVEIQFLSQLDLYRAQAGIPALIELMHRVRERHQRAPQEIVLRWSGQVVTAAVPPRRPEGVRRSATGALDGDRLVWPCPQCSRLQRWDGGLPPAVFLRDCLDCGVRLHVSVPNPVFRAARAAHREVSHG